MTHWAEKYIGKPYIYGKSDCARLVCDVRREVFNLPVPEAAEPGRRDSMLGLYRQLSDVVGEWLFAVDDPEEGDAVLMLCRGRPSHIGVFCKVAGEPCVLHAMKNAGMVVLHRLREIEKYFLSVEGFYRWK
ncbi:hypothetical protein AGMMS50256_27500 [Betaproteobacteria bacterium]|nr:hypothetical protein AGMMS50256_27500 [Betaproteobacteria bacterium]